MTTNSDSRYLIYKDNQFIGLNALSGDLLDETAEILQFAKFVNPNEQQETEPSTIQPATNSVSTPDAPSNNNSKNTTNPNNANGSIPTGQNNSIALFSILIFDACAIILLTAKKKNSK